MQITSKKKTRGVLTTVLLISVGLHVAALAVLGAVRIVQHAFREEKVFEAPPIDPPPQDEPEYTVNLQRQQQSSSPPPPNPIVVNNPQDIDVPALDIDVTVATTSAYGRGSGGFGSGGGSKIREMAVDLTGLGYTGFVEGTLEGTLFDFKKDHNGKPLVDYDKEMPFDNKLGNRMKGLCQDFLKGTWSLSELKRTYYASENNLYASYFIIPVQAAIIAPQSFGADDIDPISIAALYQGEFIPQESGRFRFFGFADDILVVQINNRIVFEGSWYKSTDHKSTETETKLFGVGKPGWYGDWMNWTAGKPMKIEVFLAELPGGAFGAWLLLEKEGESKPRIFTTKPLTAKEKRLLRDSHPDASKFL